METEICLGNSKLLFWRSLPPDVKQERQHNELIQDVENFNQDRLKRASTQEKIVLPNAQGSPPTRWLRSALSKLI